MTEQPSLLPDLPGRYAQVALPVPVAGPFTYRIPADLLDLVLPGMRVRVNFSGRRISGIVVAVLDRIPEGLRDDQVRSIEDCLDREPLLSATLLTLAAEVASEVMVSQGEVLQLALPSFGEPGVERRVRLLSVGARSADPARQRILGTLRDLGAQQRWVRAVEVVRRARAETPFARLHALELAGDVALRDEWQGEAHGATVTVARLAAGVSLEQARAATARAAAQRRVCEALAETPQGALERDLVARLSIGSSVLAALERKGLVERERRRPEAPRDWTLGAGGAGTFALTLEQRAALQAIERQLDAAVPVPVLLHGVTGSGKTEVYLRAAARCLHQGRSALLLVPEIGLTPQLQERALAVLGSSVAVLHSGMSRGERLRAWWRVRTGAARVVVGPRSAVFAPLDGLGLVVIDEEQDAAYKQEERPRYNGRDVAMARARLEGAVAVLGSATPSVETYHLSGSEGLVYQPLLRRVASRPLPTVSLVDMREEFRDHGRTLLSRQLEDAIAARLTRGEQALVLLNRRGFAATVLCRVCGARVECPDCAVTLTLHREESSLRCHYCDRREALRIACDQCGAERLHEFGSGTERLQAALSKRFPVARVGRFDADQTRQRGSHARILSSFGNGEIDVLVGTQMLAKGHDFHGVTLVGVVGADAALGMPDFRAGERTFQLLTQMAGRAGRGEIAGEVILQAHQPGHYAIAAAVNHDYEAFFTEEIDYRRRLRYPPFVALAACVCRGKVHVHVKEEADRLAAALREVTAGAITVLGPASPPLGRLRGKFRLQVLLKGRSREELTLALAEAQRLLERRRQAPKDLVIDIDPLNLM